LYSCLSATYCFFHHAVAGMLTTDPGGLRNYYQHHAR
jgi:hypothetical protein